MEEIDKIRDAALHMLEAHVYFCGVDIEQVPIHHERAGFEVSWLLHPEDRVKIMKYSDPALPPWGVSFRYDNETDLFVISLFGIPCRIDRDREPGTIGLALEGTR